jgi:hypothetical protein
LYLENNTDELGLEGRYCKYTHVLRVNGTESSKLVLSPKLTQSTFPSRIIDLTYFPVAPLVGHEAPLQVPILLLPEESLNCVAPPVSSNLIYKEGLEGTACAIQT